MAYGFMSDAALSVAANAVSANVYAGKLYEFVGPCTVRVRASASAVGLQATVLANGVAVMPDQAISQSNTWPKLPDDMVIQFPFDGGRLILTFRNTTVGALTVNHVTEIIG
jgi:hypothetical protein